MNVLYVTNLSSNISAGPNWSVPARIKAQEKIDNCLWVNLTDAVMEHWHETKCYHNLRDFGEGKISLGILPPPFDSPDVVVFEGFYHPSDPKFARELRRAGVPYVVVPRGSLTQQAMNNHSKWKKRIAHFLVFNRYVHKARAIQYLTMDEFESSGPKWNKNHFILSNGFSTPKRFKQSFPEGKIRSTFIGRLDMFHKGIDILLEAINAIQDELRNAGFELCFYGPQRYDYDKIDNIINSYGINDFVAMGGEISGIPKEELLLRSDLFVLTSRFEGHPMGLVEALAYGVPALVTPGSNMAKEIQETNSGWVCSELSVDEIVRKLRQMICDKQVFQVKSDNAKKLAERYDWDKLALNLHDELVKIL